MAATGCTAWKSSTCASGLACKRDVPARCFDPNWAEWPMPNGVADVAAFAPNLEGYIDNGDGTVTDKITGLMWQQAVPTAIYTWTDANAYCPTLNLAGHSDWRLPTVIELISIVNPDIPNPGPTIVETFFPATPSATFWTSTPYAGYPTRAGDCCSPSVPRALTT
jgi:uncharacterized protein DUF1566